MKRKAYIPDENLPGYTTFVTEKSKDGLPLGISREKESVLPPGSATPNAPRRDDSAMGSSDMGRNIPSVSFNTPEMGVTVAPRSLPTPGEIEGTPTKFDYNMVTRRTMKAYKPRTPWKRQKNQKTWAKLESKKTYQLNKSKIKHKAKLWYKKVKQDSRFISKKQKRRDDPEKYERHVMAYTPTSMGVHRHRQHGPAKMHSHRRYVHNRAKAHRQHHMWYQRNKNKPAFKRRQKMRRLHPQRFKMRTSAIPAISFLFGQEGRVGTIESIDGEGVLFVDAVGANHLMSPAAFLHAVVFDTPESLDAMFEYLDQSDYDVYADMDVTDLQSVARLYNVAVPDIWMDDPDVLSAYAKGIVEDAMGYWDNVGAMATRVARRYLQAGSVMLYDQQAPGEWEKPDTEKRPYRQDGPDQWRSNPSSQTHTPSNDMPAVEESGVNFPASSGKVIPDTMKYAATLGEIESHTSQDVLKKSRSVKVSLSKADPKNGMWTFKAVGSEGDYVVRVKATVQGNTKDVGKLPVQVSCSCAFFQYQGPEHWAKTNDYLYGKPKGTASKPTVKDPSGKNWACKHVLACLRLCSKYKVAGSFFPTSHVYVPVWV